MVSIVKVRFIESQSIHGWCHFSTAVLLCHRYLLQNVEFKQKTLSISSLIKCYLTTSLIKWLFLSFFPLDVHWTSASCVTQVQRWRTVSTRSTSSPLTSEQLSGSNSSQRRKESKEVCQWRARGAPRTRPWSGTWPAGQYLHVKPKGKMVYDCCLHDTLVPINLLTQRVFVSVNIVNNCWCILNRNLGVSLKIMNIQPTELNCIWDYINSAV